MSLEIVYSTKSEQPQSIFTLLHPYVPLGQTLLWVILITTCLLCYRKTISLLVGAILARIEGGSGIKAFGVELGEIRPQDAATQSAQLEAEALVADPESTASHDQSLPQQSRPDVKKAKSEYLQAEDLALRALQADLRVTIGRQMMAGTGLIFDGTFVQKGSLNIVEVKFLRTVRSLSGVRSTLDQLIGGISRQGWKNVKIHIVIVTDGKELLAGFEDKLSEIKSHGAYEITPHFYDLSDLRERFGL